MDDISKSIIDSEILTWLIAQVASKLRSTHRSKWNKYFDFDEQELNMISLKIHYPENDRDYKDSVKQKKEKKI